MPPPSAKSRLPRSRAGFNSPALHSLPPSPRISARSHHHQFPPRPRSIPCRKSHKTPPHGLHSPEGTHTHGFHTPGGGPTRMGSTLPEGTHTHGSHSPEGTHTHAGPTVPKGRRHVAASLGWRSQAPSIQEAPKVRRQTTHHPPPPHRKRSRPSPYRSDNPPSQDPTAPLSPDSSKRLSASPPTFGMS